MHVHEVQVEEHRLLRIVFVDQSRCLLVDAVGVGPERAARCPGRRCRVERHSGRSPVGSRSSGRASRCSAPHNTVAGLVQQLGQRHRPDAERVARVDQAMAARPERGEQRRHRDLGPRGLGADLLEDRAACGPARELRRRVTRIAVGGGPVRAQGVHDDQNEVRASHCGEALGELGAWNGALARDQRGRERDRDRDVPPAALAHGSDRSASSTRAPSSGRASLRCASATSRRRASSVRPAF